MKVCFETTLSFSSIIKGIEGIKFIKAINLCFSSSLQFIMAVVGFGPNFVTRNEILALEKFTPILLN